MKEKQKKKICRRAKWHSSARSGLNRSIIIVVVVSLWQTKGRLSGASQGYFQLKAKASLYWLQRLQISEIDSLSLSCWRRGAISAIRQRASCVRERERLAKLARIITH